MKITLLFLFWLLMAALPLRAQDPLYLHFYQHEAAFNPALVGIRGATSVLLKYKNQWDGRGANPYQTGMLAFEESMPCSIFDYGLAFGWDQEGAGLLQTYDLGFRFAGAYAIEGRRALHNLKAGAVFQLTHKRIDYGRLLFSDELDPKYGPVDANGNDLPTNFVPPNDGRSPLIFTPGIGLAYRFLSDQDAKRPWSLLAGVAYHNALSLGKGDRSGHQESLLFIGTNIPERLNFFIAPEFIPYNNNQTYLAVTPLLAYQQQGKLQYWELGGKVALNRLLSAGLYYHFPGQAVEGNHSNWLTVSVEFGEVVSKSTRIDIGLAYSNTVTGLRNSVGPLLELSLGLHFATSGMCKLMGRDDLMPYSNGVRCPTTAFSPGRRKMYENIWYKTLNQ